MTSRDPGRSLTAKEILELEPNKPARRRLLVTHSSLTWEQQAEEVCRICSKAVAKLSAMLDMADEPEAVRVIVAALSQLQGMAKKAGEPADGSQAIGDEQLVNAAKRA